MIEKVLRDYLSSKLSVPVVMENTTETEYVLIEKTGSGESNYIHSATFAIQSYSDSLYGASQLNEAVKSAMQNIIELDVVSDCSLNSDYNYTDLSEKRYRYQAVFNLTHY